MRIRSRPVPLLGLAIGLGSALAVFAQDAPAPKLKLSGSYEIAHATVGEESVSLDFTATIANLGEEDVSGPVVLRHPNVIQKVWKRFGDQSIAAGSSVTVSSGVVVPREEYDQWTKGGSPAVFFYMQNDRGEIKTFRVPLTKIAKPAGN